MKITFFISLLILLFSCYNGNKEILDMGKQIYIKDSKSLLDLVALFDSTYMDSCNVFHINMSTTTALFIQESEIDHLYDSTKFKEINLEQEKIIRLKKPRQDLVGISYLKNVFLAFAINQSNHSSLDLSHLVYIIDSSKFNYIYKFNILTENDLKQKTFNDFSTNWVYYIDKNWAISTGLLVHDGSDSICNYLKK